MIGRWKREFKAKYGDFSKKKNYPLKRKNLNPVFLLLFACFFANLLNAQNTVSGTLIDENDLVVGYAEIVVSTKDSIMTSEFTDHEGNFSIDLSKGSYILIFNYFGNEVFEKEYICSATH